MVSNAPPDAVFSFGPLGPFEPEEGQQVTFDASGTTDPGSGDTIDSYVWDFGDGNSATGKIVTHIYDNNDTYTVTLTATDNDGSSASTTVDVVVYNVTPIAFGQSVTTLEDTAVGITLVVEEPSIGDLSNLIYTISGPANGVLTGEAPSLTYTPESELLGLRYFHFLRGRRHGSIKRGNHHNFSHPVKDFDFLGFQEPWHPPFPIYRAKVGSAIPLKWQYSKDGVIWDSGDFLHRFGCGDSSTAKRFEETRNTTEDQYLNFPGASDYRYSESSGTWQFNWDTERKR